MVRDPKFVCVDCGQESDQTMRGGRPRKRCPACQRKFKIEYAAKYYRDRKAARAEAAQS